jgi:hypothetical protein
VCHIEVHHHVLHSGKATTQIQDYIEKNSTNTLAYFSKEKEIFYRGHLADEAFRAVGVLFALLFRETTLLESML